MSREKKKKAARLSILPNVLENPVNMAGKWNDIFFKTPGKPIILEVGCGKGEYTLTLAKQYPEKNFIGIDVKEDRLWVAAKAAYEQSLSNAGFLRILAEHIETYFVPGEVSEIWLTFPDPFPKPCKANKRLMSPDFINRYRRIIQEDGHLYLKTDNSGLFDFALASFRETGCTVIKQSADLHREFPDEELMQIHTTFEKKYMAEGIPIRYAEVELDPKRAIN